MCETVGLAAEEKQGKADKMRPPGKAKKKKQFVSQDGIGCAEMLAWPRERNRARQTKNETPGPGKKKALTYMRI